MKKFKLLLCLSICFVAVGCGDKVPLRGTVTFTDGETAPHGTVIFQKDGFVARGEIQPDGSYRVSSAGVNDGLLPGEYSVHVQGITGMPPVQLGATMPPLPGLLHHPRYSDPETSGLSVTVPARGNRFDIVLERQGN